MGIAEIYIIGRWKHRSVQKTNPVNSMESVQDLMICSHLIIGVSQGNTSYSEWIRGCIHTDKLNNN